MDVAREHLWERSASRGAGLFPDLPAGTVARATAEHVERFLRLRRQRGYQPTASPQAPEDLYLVDENDSSLREIVGFRLRGHPLAMLGAVRFPRHVASFAKHGRPSLAFFFSKPPTQVGAEDAAPPQGMLEVYLPHVDETIPDMVERLRRDPSRRGVYVDVDLVDFAFDLRFVNPSAIPQHGLQANAPERRLFRTTYGHVLSGLSVGLYKTLRKGLQFVTLTDAMQHRPSGDDMLPTLAFNRGALAMEAPVGPEGRSDAAETLAFHPSAATPMHLFGWTYDHVRQAETAG